MKNAFYVSKDETNEFWIRGNLIKKCDHLKRTHDLSLWDALKMALKESNNIVEIRVVTELLADLI